MFLLRPHFIRNDITVLSLEDLQKLQRIFCYCEPLFNNNIVFIDQDAFCLPQQLYVYLGLTNTGIITYLVPDDCYGFRL